MRKYLLLIIFLGITKVVFSQIHGFNYIPLEFNEIEPLWTHVSYDSTIVGLELPDSIYNYDGYNHIRSFRDIEDELLIHEGYVYLVSRTIYANDYSGAQIEKIDLETGELVWQTQFDLRTIPFREFVFKTIISDQKLLLICLQVTTDLPWLFFGGATGYVKTREYDLETGMLINESIPTMDASKSKLIKVASAGDVVMNVALTLDSIEVIRLIHSNEHDRILEIDTLDIKGNYLNPTDTIFSGYNFGNAYITSARKFIRLPDDTLLWLVQYKPRTEMDGEPFAQLNFYADTLVRSVEIDVAGLSGLFQLIIEDIGEEEILLSADYNFDGFGYVIVDRGTGAIKQVIDFANRKASKGWEKTTRDEDGNFFMMHGIRREDGRYFEIYKRNEDNLELKTKWSLVNDAYRASPDNIQRLDDGDYLITLIYGEDSPPFLEGNHEALIRVSPEQLCFTSSIDEASIRTTVGVALYPNPVSQELTVSFKKSGPSVLHILDMQGQQVWSKSVETVDELKVDVSDFVPGIYLFAWRNDSLHETIKFIKTD